MPTVLSRRRSLRLLEDPNSLMVGGPEVRNEAVPGFSGGEKELVGNRMKRILISIYICR